MNKPRESSDLRKAKAAQRSREWYAKPENKERARVVKAARMARDPEGERAKKAAHSKKWREENPEKWRVTWLRHKYKLSAEQVEHLLATRDLCESCLSDKASVIDHDHDSGAFRGQLCSGCNTAAGMLRDDPARALALAAYLQRFTTEPAPD